jgi:hypothetical protein
MFLIALASLFTIPVPRHGPGAVGQDVFSESDFPAAVKVTGIERMVYTRTTVRPDGRVQGCVAEISSGDSSVDRYTCSIITQRAKYVPARWTDGSPAYGVIRFPVRWLLHGPPTAEESANITIPDLELSVNRLPASAISAVIVNVEVAADETGKPSSCLENPAWVSFARKQYFPELVPIACQQVMENMKVNPAVDDTGKAVRSVQSVSVRFKLDH